MKYFTIFNTLAILIFLVLLVKRENRLEFKVLKTMFGKKVYGFQIMLWDFPRRRTPNSGNSIFSWQIIDPKYLKDEPYIKCNPSLVASIIERFSKGEL